jgi:NodT family efflux transporter outer membrane factor (OMF) lipoprotein
MSAPRPRSGAGPAAESDVVAVFQRSLGRFFFGCVLAAGLAACATVGPNFQSPAAPSPPGYAMAGDAATPIAPLTPDARASGEWWKALGSADLDRVMAQALVGNQTVAAADAALARARAEAQSVGGGLAPRLDASALAERQRINFQSFGFPNISNPTLDLYSVGGTVSYDLDLFGAGRRRLETANALTRASGWRADAAYLTLTGNVAMQAVLIAGLRAEADAVREIIADDQRNIDMIRAAEAVGGEPMSATTGGRAQRAEDEALLPPIERDLASARHALALLVGRSPAEWTAPDFAFAGFTPPARIPLSLPSDLAHGRPDILAAEAQLHADTARIGVATANLYPDIRLMGSLAQGAVTPDKIFSYDSTGWSLGPSLTLPLLNGGALKADRRAAEAQARASLAQYRQTVLAAFVQIADVLTALAHDDEQLTAVDHARASAQSALDEARDAYRLGGGAMLNVLDAQRRLDRARLKSVQAQGRRLADIVTLFAATASDWRPSAALAAGA